MDKTQEKHYYEFKTRHPIYDFSIYLDEHGVSIFHSFNYPDEYYSRIYYINDCVMLFKTQQGVGEYKKPGHLYLDLYGTIDDTIHEQLKILEEKSKTHRLTPRE